MRMEVVEAIKQNPDWVTFIREQPVWYRKLARHPHNLETFEIAALQHLRKTIPHRVENFSNGVQMASIMMSMFQAMNQK